MTPPPRVYIQQNCIAHYRKAIFERLSTDPRFDFLVITDTKADTPFLQLADLSTGTVRFREAENRIFSLPFIRTLFWQPDAIRLAWCDRPDAIVALGNPYSLTAWGLLLVGKLRRTPVLLWSHGLLDNETGLKWAVRKCLYRLAAGHLLYGDHAKALLMQKGFSSDQLHVVYNSLDFNAQRTIEQGITEGERHEFRASLGVKPGQGLVVFTGRLQPVKRLDLLIQAIEQLDRRGRVVHAAVVGTGVEQSALQQLCHSLHVEDRVHFLGESYDDHFLGLVLATSDLCVIPSGAGLSIMHALAFGTPVLLHDRTSEHFPEWEAVKDQVTGFYYRCGDIEDLALKIEQAIFPQPRKQELAQACRNIIRDRYNPQVQADLITAAIAACLASFKSRGGDPR